MRKWLMMILMCFALGLILVACQSNHDEKNEKGSEDDTNNTEVNTNNNENDENSNENNQADEKETTLVEGEEIDPDEEKELAEVPVNFEDTIDYPLTGEFAGEKYDENKAEIEAKLDELPEPDDAQDDESIKYIYSLFHEGYSLPNTSIDEWEAMTVGDIDDAEEENPELKEEYHVAILLDASGSMANYENEKTRMELAKESIENFVSGLPEQAQVTLQVYGHEGDGTIEAKEKSCSSVETVYDLDQYDQADFNKALDPIEPAGWTPLAKAIEDITEEFKEFDGENHTNIIYVVSDGEETCDGDPVDTVKKLSDSNIEPVINLIGYQATKEGIDQLKEMAEASEGNFINATNQDQLNDEFEKARNMSEIWADWNADKQEEFKDIKEVVAGQIDDWEEKMSERQKRQEDNLQEALDYILDEREFDLGPVPGNAYKQNRIQLANGIKMNHIQISNENKLEYIKKSNDAKMTYFKQRYGEG